MKANCHRAEENQHASKITRARDQWLPDDEEP